jgi:D-beta-D-heptose 7-phosphate kinase/D-beta-D-heptose 1-phosphate adenosyltransferase
LETIPQQKSFKVLLLGESCIDEYHYGVCERICAEAPVPVFDYIESEVRPGMAANVKENLISLGVDIEFISNDSNLLIKRRFVDTKSNQLLLREDIGNTVPPIKVDFSFDFDAVVISDYCKGLLTEDVIDYICENSNIPIFIDSKNPNLKIFKNAIVKINGDEEKRMKTIPLNSELIVTLGKSGAKWNNKLFAAPQVDVFDVTGAGDIFLASLCYFYLSTKKLEVAISKAVHLASKSVQHMGVYKLTQQDIMEVI